jgi:hypothetical protein
MLDVRPRGGPLLADGEGITKESQHKPEGEDDCRIEEGQDDTAVEIADH